MFMAAFMNDLFNSLGIFLPFGVSNCIVFGRAEAFASKNGVIPAIVDGFGMGFGFTLAIVAVGIFREIVGTGAIDLWNWYLRVFSDQYAISFFAQPAGAFVAFGLIVGFMFSIKSYNDIKAKAVAK